MKSTIFTAIVLLSLPGFTVELKFGDNHIICENPEIGQFDIDLLVNDIVTDTEYYSDENKPATPSWQHLDSKLTQLYFTSGSRLAPTGVKVEIQNANLAVLRNVFKNPANKEINFDLTFPKGTFITDSLFIDHTHPDEYESSELGAQSYLWMDKSLAQVFFKCH